MDANQMSMPEALTLQQYNSKLKQVIAANRELAYRWIVADTSDVRVSGGHCYLELVQKDPETNRDLARMRAAIWASTWAKLKYKFEDATGQAFTSNMKVMVQVTPSFHELYGLSLYINDINPAYTLGDMARQRMEIIKRLTNEGIIDMNRTLPFYDVPQRIAVISAANAAGYGDFMNQLERNAYGLKYYTCLFPATMQGFNTVPSVIEALLKINDHIDLFDCVVVIRGGGSTSDLNSFDNYDLAAYIAQFPIPVITGIGHERDVTVLDYVARRAKTPTAAAEMLIGMGADALAHLSELTSDITLAATSILGGAKQQLQYFASTVPIVARNKVENSAKDLQHYMIQIPQCAKRHIDGGMASLKQHESAIRAAIDKATLREQMRLDKLTEMVNLLSPRNTLQRGYSLTTIGGKFVTSSADIRPGDVITTHLSSGAVTSKVELIKK